MGTREPGANPIKGHVVGVIYAPSSEQGEDLEAAAERFFMLLRSNCKAVECSWAIPES